MNKFVKSHGLGNEYIVFDSEDISFDINKLSVARICNIHMGIGADGLLFKTQSKKADFGLRIFNPDGSEAEKSGNGLRIFCKYLYDYEFVSSRKFSVDTKGGIVQAEIIEITQEKRARIIKIEMGKADFNCKTIPVDFNKPECLDEPLEIHYAKGASRIYDINCVSVGNPHCVIFKDDAQTDAAYFEIIEFGTFIENHPMFPNRTNVQFVQFVPNTTTAYIRIWERGAGYTLASGSSSCAVASVLKKRGYIKNHVTIQMPGGSLKIEIDDDWNITMTGEVRQIAEGYLSNELIEDIKALK